MISLRNVTSSASAREDSAWDLYDVTLDIPTDRSIGILAPTPTARTLAIQLLAGLKQPASGEISRYAHVSLPIGYSGAFNPMLSVRRNIADLSAIFDADADEVSDLVEAAIQIGNGFDLPLQALSKEARVRVVFAVGYALPFDCYLVDESFAFGSPEFRERCVAMFEARLASSGMILGTCRPSIIEKYCDAAILLHGEKLIPYASISEAIADFGVLTQPVEA